MPIAIEYMFSGAAGQSLAIRYWESIAAAKPITERIVPFLNLELRDERPFIPKNIRIYPIISLVISMCTVPKEIQNLVQIKKIPIRTNKEFFLFILLMYSLILNVFLINRCIYSKLIWWGGQRKRRDL